VLKKLASPLLRVNENFSRLRRVRGL
jgi:hypothetical protein